MQFYYGNEVLKSASKVLNAVYSGRTELTYVWLFIQQSWGEFYFLYLHASHFMQECTVAT